MNLEQLKLLAAEEKLHGLFPDVENGVYHHAECPGVSSSFLKKMISETPLHAKSALGTSNEDSPALRLGSAAHDSILLPEVFAQNYIACPEGMKRDARTKAYQEFMAANEGKTILSADEFKQIIGIRDAVMSHKRAVQLLDGARTEHSAWWTDEDTGVLCKVRPDILTKQGFIVDLKTTNSASAWDFSRSVHQFGYHISAAMYLAGMSVILGQPVELFILLAVEKNPPYGVAAYVLDSGTLEKGMDEFRRALLLYKQCIEMNEWPGYPQDFMDLAIPSYAFFN